MGRDWQMTAEQEEAATELYLAIDQLIQQGVYVPCQDPVRWGEGEDPAACTGCPLMAGACLRFAASGAITSGALAGMKMSRSQIDQAAHWLYADEAA